MPQPRSGRVVPWNEHCAVLQRLALLDEEVHALCAVALFANQQEASFHALYRQQAQRHQVTSRLQAAISVQQSSAVVDAGWQQCADS
jgi:hypothetical protein